MIEITPIKTLDGKIKAPSSKNYQGIKAEHFSIPGDYSSASFFLVAEVIFGKVRVEGLDKDDVFRRFPIQGHNEVEICLSVSRFSRVSPLKVLMRI